ncbi:MAG: TraB/GumN family protein [Saprospiraceae bacterium]
MLFKFYHPDSQIVHYLFGTIHLRNTDAYTHAKIAEKYITKVSTYCAEMDLNNDGVDLLPYMTLQDGNTNSSYWGARKFSKFRMLCLKAYALDLEYLDHMTPFYIHNMITESIIGKSDSDPLDMYLWKFAMGNEKKMMGLESLEDQINILQKIPLPFQYKMLQSTFKNSKTYYQKVHKLVELYKDSNLKSLYKSTKKSMGGLRDLMIYNRNIRMTERIQILSRTESLFVAVGAAHLPGNNGIIALLKRSGYKVQVI